MLNQIKNDREREKEGVRLYTINNLVIHVVVNCCPVCTHKGTLHIKKKKNRK